MANRKKSQHREKSLISLRHLHEKKENQKSEDKKEKRQRNVHTPKLNEDNETIKTLRS